MATGLALVLRAIQPHDRMSAHKPNEWRRYSVQQAKAAGVSRRRWLRADTRAKRAGARS